MNLKKNLFGCFEGDTFCNGKHWNQRTISGHLLYRLHEWRRDTPRNIRWFIAAWLRRIACWIMGEKWYVSDCWASTPGNRVAELHQQIWEWMVSQTDLTDRDRRDELDSIGKRLSELAQIAGESWGHIYPKEQKPK